MPIVNRVTSTLLLGVTLLIGNVAAQTELIDVDAFGEDFEFGWLSSDRTEYLYRIDNGVDPASLFAYTFADRTTRQLPTTGIDVGLTHPEPSQGRLLVFDGFTSGINNAYSVDYLGQSPPVLLNPEPDALTSASLHQPTGTVAILLDGDPNSSVASERDRLLTLPILGGPTTEVLGGIDRFREVSSYRFSASGQHLLVGTRTQFETTPVRTSDLFLTVPGTTGKTPVFPNDASNTRYIVHGSDGPGEHFLVESVSPQLLWSVPVDSPGSPVRLDERADGSDIANDHVTLDVANNRVLFTSSEPKFNGSGQQRVESLMASALDGSGVPTVLGNLPAGVEPSFIIRGNGSEWTYVTTTGNEFAEGPLYAVSDQTGAVVELAGLESGGVSRVEIEFGQDGTFVVFADDRVAGNDLFIGRPGATAAVETLLDISVAEQIVGIELDPNESLALVSLVDAGVPFAGVADRIVAVPLDGTTPTTLLDVRGLPVETYILTDFPLDPLPLHGEAIYVLADVEGQTGMFSIELPTSGFLGDFNGDGTVDLLDLDILGASFGLTGTDLATGDANGDGTTDLLDLDILGANFGSTAMTAIPEPVSAALLVVAFATASLSCRQGKLCSPSLA